MLTKIRNSILATSLLAIPLTASSQVAQEMVDLNVIQQIREEGLERSHMDQMAQYMTDVIGPRLTVGRASTTAAGFSHLTCSRCTPRQPRGPGVPTVR